MSSANRAGSPSVTGPVVVRDQRLGNQRRVVVVDCIGQGFAAQEVEGQADALRVLQRDHDRLAGVLVIVV